MTPANNTNLKPDQKNKWALLIGISEYPFMPDIKSAGSINDSTMMLDTLQKGFGFQPRNTIHLQNEDATYDNIINSMNAILKNVKEHDEVLFYYSGQGSQVPDTEKKWEGGLVSTIAAYDTGRDSDFSNQITYCEIHDWLMRLNAIASNATIIIDAAHAGTITTLDGMNRETSLKKNYVFLGACSSDQVALEYNDEYSDYGAFTYALAHALIESDPRATYRDVFEKANAWLVARSLPRPRIEGNSNRLLFGSGKARIKHYVTVEGRAIDQVTLGAGSAYGLTARSLWAIYRAGSGNDASQSNYLGLVEVTRVEIDHSEAKILSEVGGDAGIAPGAEASEESHYYGDMCLSVEVKDAANLQQTVEYLKGLIKESLLLRLANGKADVTAMILAPGYGPKEIDLLPQLRSVAEPTWVVADKFGSILMTTSAANPEVVWKIRDSLEKWSRYKNIRDLRNPNANSLLFEKVDLKLKKKDPDGRKLWVEIKAMPDGGMPVLREGDRFIIEVTNYYENPLYIAIFDFKSDGAFSLLRPQKSGSEELLPGQVLRINQGIHLPKIDPIFMDRPMDISMADAKEGIAGGEMIKLFATTSKIDLANLVCADVGITDECGQNKALLELLDMALTGYGTREAKPVNLPAEQEWTTVERSFLCGYRMGESYHA